MNYELILIGILLLLILIDMGQLQKQVKHTNSILEKIAKQIGVPDTIAENIDDELKELMGKGKKVKAIKRYREVTGAGLKESEEYVDSLDK